MSGPADLDEVVKAYVPDGDDVSVSIARAALETGRPMWPRTEFDPGHFTASGFVLSPDRSSVLLIFHRKLRRWLQPGGHIEAGDVTVESAARREVAEETGLSEMDRVGSNLIRIDAHPIPSRGDEPDHTHIDLAVGFVARTEKIDVLDEVLDTRWVSLIELNGYSVDDATRRATTALTALV